MSEVLALLDDSPNAADGGPRPWQVLVVDDEPEVHTVTRLCYSNFTFEGRRLDVISAKSAAEAREILRTHPDIALVLLDVVMETDHAGLDLAACIRKELGNHTVRIVLRTGQPGEAPPRDIVREYEIDDYRTKTELTFERLHVLTMTTLRTYRLLREQADRERRLAQYSEELEHFASAASHDLQTPLRTIVSFAKLLEDRLGGTLEGDTRDYLGYLVQGARDLHALIGGLMEFTRIGRTTPALSPVPLADIVKKACAELQRTLDERNALVDCGELPIVRGNAEQLQQLFRHLIDNAIKFQPSAQPVVSIHAVVAGGTCEVRVSDRGIGIEPQYLGRIFEPFQRLHPVGKYPGSGIGLAICRKLAQLHGGSIRAQSVPGTGTTVVVTLPVDKP